MTLTPLRVGHGNGHNDRTLVEFVRDADADSFGGNEAQRLLPALKKIPDHRVTVAGSGYDSDRGRIRSTCIVTRDGLTNMGEIVLRVAEEVPDLLKWAPDRALVGSCYEHPVATKAGHRGVAHFELHNHATVKNRDPEAQIVKEHRQALRFTRHQAQALRRMGYLVVITGDLQLPEGFEKPWGPEVDLAGPLNLRTRTVGIDWILVDKALRFAGPMDIEQLHDHRGFVADLLPA